MKIKGIPASPGIAIGKTFLYKENKLEIDEKSNSASVKASSIFEANAYLS